ncbi:MAG: hypothetical protein SVV03_02440 [Candidatus Nanohaloarchaea archaeon]|nr:hypothetical protein [Candidatus Nanohaloarchaea archaeon]
MSEAKSQAYEAKAVDKANVNAWDDPVLSDMVDTEARRNRVMRQLSRQVVNIADAPTDTYKARSRGSLDAASQSENTQITSEDISHSTTDITVSKYGKRTTLTTEGEEDGMGTQAEEIQTELGVALADKEDQEAYNTVANTALTNVNTQDNATDGKVQYTDLNQLRAKLHSDGYDPDAVIVHPDFEADLLNDNKVIDNDYSDEKGADTGEFGSVLGMTVYMTRAANGASSTSGDVVAVMLDSDHAFDTVIKRSPTVETEREPDYDRWQIVGTMRFGHGVINEKAIGHVVN